MENIILWIEQNMGIIPEVQLDLLASLLTVIALSLVYQLLLRGLIRRIPNLKIRYQSQKAIKYLFFALSVLFLAQIWFNGIFSLATYFGLLSAGLAIALRDPITDILGWIFILTTKTIEVGDRVQVGVYSGDVIDRGVFQFSLMEIGNWVDAEQSTGRILNIPNAMVFTTVVANYSRGLPAIWNEIPVLLSFGSDWEKAKELLEQIASQQPTEGIEEAEASLQEGFRNYIIQYNKLTPIVYTNVKSDGVLLTVRYLCDPRQRRDSTQAIWEAILKEFARQPDIRLAGDTEKSLAQVPQLTRE